MLIDSVMDNKNVNLKQKFKTLFSALVAIVLALCFCFAAIGCGDKETEYEYIVRVIKEEYNVEKILWIDTAVNCNTISGIDYYTPNGYVHSKESLFPNNHSGWYVLGIDNRGYETFVLVPRKQDSKIKPKVYQWPFAYTFTEIVGFAAEYGYKYKDGIGDSLGDFLNDENGALHVLDKKYDKYGIESKDVGTFTELFEDPDKKYDELDVKFVFNFSGGYTDEQWTHYYITQESGKLILYEVVNTDAAKNINAIEYSRDKQDVQTQVA